MRMSARDVCLATGAALLEGDGTAEVTGVTIDSREVRPHAAFVAFAGERTDGNRYARAALEAGASLVVLTAEPDQADLELAGRLGSCVARAADDDGTAFMLALAGAWRERNPQWLVVGVTGSVGKTTTKEMLACALGTRYRVHATKGNLNNLLGVPLTLLSAPDDAELLVVEMGMNHAGELTRLSHAARPNVAVVTNVGTSHIGNLGSRENIARAKAEVVSGMVAAEGRERPTLVLSAADDFTDFIAERFCAPAGVDVLRVGAAPSADVRATGISVAGDGCAEADLSFPDGARAHARLHVPGRHMVADLLDAMAVAWELGADVSRAAGAVGEMRPAHMRLEVVERPHRPRVIDDSYNASPSSVAAALDVLCSMECAGRRVAVLGEVGELGRESARLHGYIGAYAAAKSIDLLVVIGGEGAAQVAEAARTMGFSEDALESFDSVDSALAVIAPVLTEDDLVLVKASRSAGLDQFAKGVYDR